MIIAVAPPCPSPLRWQRIGAHPHPLPARATDGSAGYDLAWAGGDPQRPPRRTLLVPHHPPTPLATGWAVEIPPGHVGLLRARSSLAARGVVLHGGVIDADYRGELVVLLSLCADPPLVVTPGLRIAQLLIVPCATPPSQEATRLSVTSRGAAGFGSTGA